MALEFRARIGERVVPRIADAVALGHALKRQACDFLDVSSGGVVADQEMNLRPGYQLPFASQIKQEVGLPTVTVGLISRPHSAEAIPMVGHAGFVWLARAMFDNPRWLWHAANALGAKLHLPVTTAYAVAPRWRRNTEEAGVAPDPVLAAAEATIPNATQ